MQTESKTVPCHLSIMNKTWKTILQVISYVITLLHQQKGEAAILIGEIDVNLRAERKFLAIYLLNSGKSVTFAAVKQKREDRC